MPETFDPITTQDQLDRIITARVKRERDHARKWETRAKDSLKDADTWRRQSRLWETRARQNLAVIRAHEGTIAKFIERLDDVLTDEED